MSWREPRCRTAPRASSGSAFPTFAGDALEALRLRLLDLYSAQLAIDTALFEGCEAVLDDLAARDMPWGIVTNKPGFLTDPLLAALGLRPRARAAWCRAIRSRSASRILRHCCWRASQLALPPEQCLYVGDAERDVQSARAAGMPVLVARYGYLGPGRRSGQPGGPMHRSMRRCRSSTGWTVSPPDER